jgi:hypothetical protein
MPCTHWNATCSPQAMVTACSRGSRQRDDRRCRLVVIERGASTFVDRGEGFDETVAITQLHDEHPADFADRAVRRIAKTQKGGECFDLAVLFVGPADDEATCSARRLISLAIAAHAGSSPGLTELVVFASSTASQGLRARLLELTDDLVFGTEGKPLPVRIHFIDARRGIDSGEQRLATARGRSTRAREGPTRRRILPERLERRLGPSQRLSR